MQNFIKTIISAVQTWTKRKIKDSTADWNQNDSNADNYIKNRPFYEENGKIRKLDQKFLDLPKNIATIDWMVMGWAQSVMCISGSNSSLFTKINTLLVVYRICPLSTDSFSHL